MVQRCHGLARAIFAAILVASTPNNPADASGRAPALPLPEEKFESHAACVAHLETLYAQDKATGQPQYTGNSIGSR
jgi:hypothetical protein